MKTFNYNLTDKHIDECIDKKDYDFIKNHEEILIQVFSGKDYEYTKNVLNTLKQKFPTAKILTTSTDGEIIHSIVKVENIIISISVFEKTKLNIYYAENNNFDSGAEIAKEIVNTKTKLLLLFADGINSNGEDFLNGVSSVTSDIVVAGGFSGDNGNFIECFVGIDDKLYTHGAVGVTFDSDDLVVQNMYSFGWDKIGIEHTITKSKNNCVYEIDNISALEFYKKYLGEKSANNLPSIGMEFPLIIESNGISSARAMTANNNDGSLNFAGNLHEGQKVYLGIGNIDKILTNNIDNLAKNSESFFIYSCMARRRFIPNDIYKELIQFIDLAPTCGFFTYGEFYTSKKYELLNQTLTAISLSENSSIPKHNANLFKDRRKITNNKNTISTLTNILNQTYRDLEEKNKILNRSVDYFKILFDTALEGIIISNSTQSIVDINEAALKIFNFDSKDEIINKKNLLDNVPIDQLHIITQALREDRVTPYETSVYTKDMDIIPILAGGKTFKRDNEVFRITTIIDLSQIKLKDRQLVQQSHLAQMGEMVNMIAHQWRQPLNTINIIATKLKMKKELNLLDSSDLVDNMDIIEEITQNMSQTINDFMNLTNPNTNKEKITFKNIFKEIKNILGAQFKSHDIEINLVDKSNISLTIQKNDLIHIIINILTNARDAFKEDFKDRKYIQIGVDKKDNIIIISIKDNAGGIRQEHITRVFEPYFTTKEKGKGTGLGLYMSKKVLNEVLNGDISVKNDNDGAVFEIVIVDNENIL